ncbi:MAG: hypothetical protein HQL87_03585 [Magnetococcales bacterium]|nr:hypothetical protein [Magnetococcales bacterium]
MSIVTVRSIIPLESGRCRLLARLWLFDLANLAPWQWFSLISTVITVIVFPFSGHVQTCWEIREKESAQAVPVSYLVWMLRTLARLRSISTVFFLVLAGGYVFLALIPNCNQTGNGVGCVVTAHGRA